MCTERKTCRPERDRRRLLPRAAGSIRSARVARGSYVYTRRDIGGRHWAQSAGIDSNVFCAPRRGPSGARRPPGAAPVRVCMYKSLVNKGRYCARTRAARRGPPPFVSRRVDPRKSSFMASGGAPPAASSVAMEISCRCALAAPRRAKSPAGMSYRGPLNFRG